MADQQLPIMAPHAPALSDNVSLPVPHTPNFPSSPDTLPSSSKEEEHQQETLSNSPSKDSSPPDITTSEIPTNLSLLAPSQDHPSDTETGNLPGDNITASASSAQGNNGDQDSACTEEPPTDKEASPKKPSTTPQQAAPLQKAPSATKHTRTDSSAMGFTGDKVQDKKVGAVALFSSLFAAKGAAELDHPVAAAAPVTQTPTAAARQRSGSTLTVQNSKNGNKGFFNSIGSSFGHAIQKNASAGSSPPESPTRSSRSMRDYSPEIGPTMLIDEFAGIPFRSLLNSFIQEPEGTAETPEEARKRTPEARLEELAVTAGDLLERVYQAYKSRTQALGDMHNEQEVTKEVMEESRIKLSEYKMQLGRLATEESILREAQDVKLAEGEKRIKELERELQRERAKREELEGELERRTTLRVNKRTSAASDSGFESDTESMFSRASQVVSPVDSFMDGGADDRSLTISTTTKCEHCTRTLTPSSASIRNPTPLSQAWSAGSDGTATPTQTPVTSPVTTTKWGFASLTRRGTSGWIGNNDTDVRAENRMLRARVGELEAVVNDVLEVVAGRERISV
ncbi:hypothetical protein P167DRAFT_575215 [Morchella conica CCBAS932]|uniref:Uncharacterized protein n=1 Tax=Morchella conica CCBAS932 TaxID=1392247 RepID=A0A3N4KLN1_9PEZI|nr:hypothetical protein P167DRAFT_575215 [Morchella conica CCBAS932]